MLVQVKLHYLYIERVALTVCLKPDEPYVVVYPADGVRIDVPEFHGLHQGLE